MAQIYLSILTLLIYLIQNFIDIILIVQYIKEYNILFAIQTVTIVLVSSIILEAFSIIWIKNDGKYFGVTCLLIHISQLGKFYRHLKIFLLSFKATWTQRIDYKIDYRLEKDDIILLDCFSCFLRSIPQIILQIHVLIKKISNSEKNYKFSVTFTYLSIIIALLHVAYSIANYIKNSDEENFKINVLPTHIIKGDTIIKKFNHASSNNLSKNAIVVLCLSKSFLGLFLQWIWRFNIICSRIIALVLFASIFEAWIYVYMILHWICMTVWISYQKTQFSGAPFQEILFRAVLGWVYCFCFFTVIGRGDKTRWKLIVHHIFIALQNVAILAVVYYLVAHTHNVHSTSFFYAVDYVGLRKQYIRFKPTYLPNDKSVTVNGTEEMKDKYNDYQVYMSILRDYLLSYIFMGVFATFMLGWIGMLIYYRYYHYTCAINPNYDGGINNSQRDGFTKMMARFNSKDLARKQLINGANYQKNSKSESYENPIGRRITSGRSSFKSSFKDKMPINVIDSKLRNNKSSFFRTYDCINDIHINSPKHDKHAVYVNNNGNNSSLVFATSMKFNHLSLNKVCTENDDSNKLLKKRDPFFSKRKRLQNEIREFLEQNLRSTYKKKPENFLSDKNLIDKNAGNSIATISNGVRKKLEFTDNQINCNKWKGGFNKKCFSQFHAESQNQISFQKSTFLNMHQEQKDITAKGQMGKKVVSIDLKLSASLLRSLQIKSKKFSTLPTHFLPTTSDISFPQTTKTNGQSLFIKTSNNLYDETDELPAVNDHFGIRNNDKNMNKSESDIFHLSPIHKFENRLSSTINMISPILQKSSNDSHSSNNSSKPMLSYSVNQTGNNINLTGMNDTNKTNNYSGIDKDIALISQTNTTNTTVTDKNSSSLSDTPLIRSFKADHPNLGKTLKCLNFVHNDLTLKPFTYNKVKSMAMPLEQLRNIGRLNSKIIAFLSPHRLDKGALDHLDRNKKSNVRTKNRMPQLNRHLSCKNIPADYNKSPIVKTISRYIKQTCSPSLKIAVANMTKEHTSPLKTGIQNTTFAAKHVVKTFKISSPYKILNQKLYRTRL